MADPRSIPPEKQGQCLAGWQQPLDPGDALQMIKYDNRTEHAQGTPCLRAVLANRSRNCP